MYTFPLPAPPATQALDSSTFKVPPHDIPITEVFDWHLDNKTDHTLFVWEEADGSLNEVKWPTAVRAVHAGAKLLQKSVGIKSDGTTTGTPTVALLTAADSCTYFITMVAVMRAGYAVAPISSRNSPAAVAHILTEMKADHLLIGTEEPMKALAQAALGLIDRQKYSGPVTSQMLLYEDLFLANAEENFTKAEYVKPQWDAPCMILHSSGSTAFPKPLPSTHYQIRQLGNQPSFGEIDMCGMKLGIHGLPMFHGLGASTICWTACAGVIAAVFRPQHPAIPPTPDSVVKGAMATRSDIIFAIPAFIEYWYRNPEYVKYVATIHGIMYGGGPLNKAVGDGYTRQGVNIFMSYGSTEATLVTPVMKKSSSVNWEYSELCPRAKGEFVPEEGDSNKAHLVIKPHPFHYPNVLNGELRGERVYWTGDIWERHPTEPNLWKVFGRADDIISHSTGEKTNPVPLEGILAQDPHIQAAVMFGRGKFFPGVIIDPRDQFKFDPSDSVKLAEFRNVIWPTVEKANEYAPQHSRLFKEMILVAQPSKPFTYTAKNTARRQAILTQYATEIEQLYDAVEETTQSNIPPPSSWSPADALAFVRKIVVQLLGRSIDDDADIFHNGCDSLQATWIRNSVLHAIRTSTELDTRGVPNLIVYQNPSITSIAAFASSFASGAQLGTEHDRIKAMEEMVKKYSSEFKFRPISPPSSITGTINKVVLLTGSTRGIGASLLARLAVDPTVSKIFTVNRPSLKKESILQRHELGFKSQDLDTKALRSGKVVFIVADLATCDLFELEEARQSVTHIIHNAWRVDFNSSLSSFEPNIQALHKLIDLSLSSNLPVPPAVILTSTIGVLLGTKGPSAESLVDAEIASSSGYTQSKWCAEQILSRAATSTGLRAAILRVGQVCGGENGYWNTTEWMPSLVKSSVHIGALPHSDLDVSWIPLGMTTKAFMELAFSDLEFGTASVYHLGHPCPVSWSSLIQPISSRLNLPVISYSDWLARLEGSLAQDGTTEKAFKGNPAIRMIDFFRQVQAVSNDDLGREAMGIKTMSMEKTKQVSATLGTAGAVGLGAEDVGAWLGYWHKEGFL